MKEVEEGKKQEKTEKRGKKGISRDKSNMKAKRSVDTRRKRSNSETVMMTVVTEAAKVVARVAGHLRPEPGALRGLGQPQWPRPERPGQPRGRLCYRWWWW